MTGLRQHAAARPTPVPVCPYPPERLLLGVKTLIMCGVVMSVCVDSTARHGYFHGYYSAFRSDCTAASSKVQRQATLETMEQAFGVVATADEVVQMWERVRRAVPE